MRSRSALLVAGIIIICYCNAHSQSASKSFSVSPKLVLDSAEFLPAYPGGDEALSKFIANNIVYPEICKENGITGLVKVRYVVDVDGVVKDATIIRGADPNLDKEALRIVNSISGYSSGLDKGKKVPVSICIPIRFQLTGKRPKLPPKKKKEITNPTYPGGLNNLYKFIYENKRYPTEALNAGITGVVRISCIVDIDGTVKSAKVTRVAHPILDQEALRIANSLTGFTPGTIDGEPAALPYLNFPVGFSINGYVAKQPIINYQAKAAYDSAKIAMAQSDFVGAIKLYTESISLVPDNYVPYYERAIARYAKKQFSQAELDFAEVLKLTGHEHFETYLYRGVMRYENGQTDYAIDDLTKAIKLNKSASTPYVERAKCFSVSGDFKSARKDLLKSLKIEPKNLEAMLNLGVVTYTEGNIEKALKQFLKVIEAYPRNGKAYYFSGMCYARLRNMTHACENLIKAKELGVQDAIPLVENQCSDK